MKNTNIKIIKILNHLITIIEDSKSGYESAVNVVKDNDIKKYFQQFVKERAWYITQLKQQINSLGGIPVEGGNLLGAIHRTWMDVKVALNSGDTDIVINACIIGEKAAIKNYKEALNEDYIRTSFSVKDILTEQLMGIENALDIIEFYMEVPVLK